MAGAVSGDLYVNMIYDMYTSRAARGGAGSFKR